MNNCYRDYAQTNAQDLMSLLTDIDADVDQPRSTAARVAAAATARSDFFMGSTFHTREYGTLAAKVPYFV